MDATKENQMKVINGYITTEDTLEVSLQPGDALADSVNPGSWETKASAAGGRGIIWSSVEAMLEQPEQYTGYVCKVRPYSIPSIVHVKVETDISTDKGQTYKPFAGEIEIQFVKAGEFSQLTMTPNQGQNIASYKKVI